MNFIDPDEPLETQILRQSKIIDALVRRATRQNDVGRTAYSAFQSAIELQARVAAKTRDLERTAFELENVRFDRERTRQNMLEAMSVMGEGFALFIDGQLDVFSEVFQDFLTDVSERIVTGLSIYEYLDLITESNDVLSIGHPLEDAPREEEHNTSIVLELAQDRWYQLSLRYTSHGNLVLLLTEITAIVRQNRSEKKHLIAQQADYLQAAFENMTSGVCTFSDSGAVMMHNLQFSTLLSLPLSILRKGMTLTDLLDYMLNYDILNAEDYALLVSWRQKIYRTGHFRCQIRNGLETVLDLQANVLPDKGFLIELKDVTLENRVTETLENRVHERTLELTETNRRLTEQYEEKARVEAKLQVAKERAEAAVSSKTRFLAAASHDLLQPINAAKLMIATLQQSAKSSPHAPMIERLRGAFNSIEYLLHGLLDISRLDSADQDALSPGTLDLGQIMQGVYENQTPLAEQKGVRLVMVPCHEFVHSDPVYLLRSIQNLVVNAIQYTGPGGKVLLGCRRKGEKLVVQVWDNGIGIGEKDQIRIFEEFARAENVSAGSGMGLGLSIVERTCRHLGHKLWMKSRPGKGSAFFIELERVNASIAPVLTRHSLPSETKIPLSHIALLVENDEDVLFATSQTLQSWGVSVLPANSTAEAITFVRDMGIPPDIMLVDHQLDDGDTGLLAIEAIRKLTACHVPAIMITANRGEALIEAGKQMDFSVLTKPVQLRRLRPLIEWKLREDPPADQQIPV